MVLLKIHSYNMRYLVTLKILLVIIANPLSNTMDIIKYDEINALILGGNFKSDLIIPAIIPKKKNNVGAIKRLFIISK